MQTKLELYPKPIEVEMFDKTYYFASKSFEYTENGYSVYLRREINEKTGRLDTVAILSGMNFLGQRGNTTFRFMSEPNEPRFTLNNDVVLPILNEMTLQDIISFVHQVLENKCKRLYKWDTDKRCYVFTMETDKEKAEPLFAHSISFFL